MSKTAFKKTELDKFNEILHQNFPFQLIPESHRATVTNWFRVPMNIITCATLLAVNHPSVAADKRSIFATCTGLLITGVVIASKFNTYMSKQKKVK